MAKYKKCAQCPQCAAQMSVSSIPIFLKLHHARQYKTIIVNITLNNK